jgi:hypothetical protein
MDRREKRKTGIGLRKTMKLHSYLNYQFHRYIMRKRWLLPIPVGLTLGYWAGKTMQALTPYEAASQGNALEGFIWAFGKPEIVYFVISILWFFLIADVGSNQAYNQQVLLRTASRIKWWLGKVIFLLLSTVAYAVVLLGSFFVPVLLKYPLSQSWSPIGLVEQGMYIGYATMNGSPVQAFWNILIFLLIGWFAISLFMLVTQMLTRQTWVGFLGSSILIICSWLGSISGGPIGGEGLESFFLLQNHLEFTPLWVPVRLIPQIYSWIFWAAWILICLGFSYFISKRQNFFADNREED